MAGTVSSLGTLSNGSSSVLNADLIDKLKTAETSARVNPITAQITKTQNQKSSLSSLIVSLSGLKSSTVDLSSDSSYLKRSATSSDASVSIAAGSGTAVQNTTIKVTQLAQNHVMQSSGFASLSSSVSSSATTMTLKLNGSTYSIPVTAGMTLEQLSQKINDTTNGAISASTLNTGVGASPYKLILKAKDQGAENTISVTEGAGLSTALTNNMQGTAGVQGSTFTLNSGDLVINGVNITGTFSGTSSAANATNLANAINSTAGVGVRASVDSTTGQLTLANNTTAAVSVVVGTGIDALTGLSVGTTSVASGGTIQNPQNSKFNYNGIAMERSKNSITDLIVGSTITINSVSTNTANLSITQNTSGITDLVNTFVSAFNTASSKLKDLTAYDSKTKVAGALQGVAEVSSIYSSLTNIITQVTSDGKSLMDYGFSLDKNGALSVDTAKLNTKLASDPAALEKLFRGSSTVNKGSYTALLAADTGTDVNIPTGAITINGVDLSSVATLASNTSEQNAQLFVDAINKIYDSTGVKAYTNGSGKLVLENPSGGKIQVTTSTAAALASGLSSSSSVAIAMTNSTVAIGSTKTTSGVFTNLNTALAGLLTKKDASLTLYDASLQSQIDSRTEEKTKTTADITTKYELLANQFAQYNSIISKFQQSFSSLQSMISAANNN